MGVVTITQRCATAARQCVSEISLDALGTTNTCTCCAIRSAKLKRAAGRVGEYRYRAAGFDTRIVHRCAHGVCNQGNRPSLTPTTNRCAADGGTVQVNACHD